MDGYLKIHIAHHGEEENQVTNEHGDADDQLGDKIMPPNGKSAHKETIADQSCIWQTTFGLEGWCCSALFYLAQCIS